MRVVSNTGIIEVLRWVLIAPWAEADRGAKALMYMPATRRNGIAMREDDEVQGTSISQAHTLEEIADFWDAHSLDDYWERTHEAAFEVRAKQRRRVALDEQGEVQAQSG